MQKDLLASLARLTDDELAADLKSLAARDHATAALVIAHLAEMDTRDIHLRAGYPSLYDYCLKVLHLSEWEAWNRIDAARAARRFPIAARPEVEQRARARAGRGQDRVAVSGRFVRVFPGRGEQVEPAGEIGVEPRQGHA